MREPLGSSTNTYPRCLAGATGAGITAPPGPTSLESLASTPRRGTSGRKSNKNGSTSPRAALKRTTPTFPCVLGTSPALNFSGGYESQTLCFDWRLLLRSTSKRDAKQGEDED